MQSLRAVFAAGTLAGISLMLGLLALLASKFQVPFYGGFFTFLLTVTVFVAVVAALVEVLASKTGQR